MCGFIASFGQGTENKDFIRAMDHLKRRGPDAEGIWTDGEIFFGSRRLAIFDLNERSNQPMRSICSRYILIFNGAIYNYKSLRNYLIEKGVELKTSSDTEVILELYALEGSDMLKKLKGMFAFVIWDIKKKEAFAARDPYGIKPLYVGLNSKGLILSSQVKTLLSTKKFKTDKDSYSDFSFNNFGYIVEPHTWFTDIKSIKSGHYVFIKNSKIVEEKKYYETEKLWINADKNIKKIDTNELLNKIKISLVNTVKKHLVSDVPIGIFLSGGVDSSILAALVSSVNRKDIKTITVLFDEFENTENDETIISKKVSEKLGLDHHIYKVTKDDFYNDLPEILKAMDQPTTDGINTWYASKAAAELNLKVVFSGLGGDEIFFGYDHYKKIPFLIKFFSLIKKIPFLNIIVKVMLNFFSLIKKDPRWKYITRYSDSVLKLWFLKRSIFYKQKKNLNKEKNYKLSMNDFYKEFLNEDFQYNFKTPKLYLSMLDSLFYMRNQLLRDGDWSSMYHGVELRTPFVDIELTESLNNLMNNYSNYENKEVLKLLFESILPKEVFSKKKVGFQTPIKKWYQSYFKENKNISSNYIHSYMDDIRNSFNKL